MDAADMPTAFYFYILHVLTAFFPGIFGSDIFSESGCAIAKEHAHDEASKHCFCIWYSMETVHEGHHPGELVDEMLILKKVKYI